MDISDSEVMAAIKILELYAKQVEESRGALYWDAKAKGNGPFAEAHLKRYRAAKYIEMTIPDLLSWYRDSK